MPRSRKVLSLAVAVAAAAGGVTTAHAASPLIGQWPLDAVHEDGASQVTPDVAGAGLDLRVANGAMHLGTPARFGTGATLATDLTPLQVTSPLLAPAQLTLLAWVRQSGNPGTLRYLAGRSDDGGICGGSTFALYTGYPGMGGLRFYVRYGTGESALSDAPADAAVFDGSWHLVAGTYDGSAARLYVDGVLVGTPKPAPAPLDYALGGGSSFYVDGYPVDGCALFNNADDWPGGIDEVRLYDRALSATELGRLAAATGPEAPALVTDAASGPAPAPSGGPAAPSGPSAGPAPTPAAQSGAKVLEQSSLSRSLGGVAGASRQTPEKALRDALASAEPSALQAMAQASATSRVGKAQSAGLSAKEAREVEPDPRLKARLEAMRYGITTQVPVAAAGQAVELVATLAIQTTSGGSVKTRTIVLPPTAGVSKDGRPVKVPIPVDAAASKAMTAAGVTDAALSVLAVQVDAQSDLSSENALRLQDLMSQRTKVMETTTNILSKLADTQQALAKNLRDDDRDAADRKKAEALRDRTEKLEQQARALEKQRDAASQKAAQALQAAVGGLVGALAAQAAGVAGATGAALPTATASIGGCARCEFAAR